ncbi:type II toxin-antitoxin system RelE/ParE family toxin [Candidatus Woesearchaeota archaeon]|nr:type II toxin-antitoxin system RelE/ParE family toxin [Candidatus Woesearchaeota archaeon]
MKPFTIRPQAQDDLDGIFDYIAQDNPQRAEQFIRALHEKFVMLSTTPEAGTARPELVPEIRGFPFKRYVIFYRSTPDGLEIVRVLHGARDIPTVFDQT